MPPPIPVQLSTGLVPSLTIRDTLEAQVKGVVLNFLGATSLGSEANIRSKILAFQRKISENSKDSFYIIYGASAPQRQDTNHRQSVFAPRNITAVSSQNATRRLMNVDSYLVSGVKTCI